MNIDDKVIAVIGLGYVGLPLATEFGRVREVIGYDISAERINDLRAGVDRTRERTCGAYVGAVSAIYERNPRPERCKYLYCHGSDTD